MIKRIVASEVLHAYVRNKAVVGYRVDVGADVGASVEYPLSQSRPTQRQWQGVEDRNVW